MIYIDEIKDLKLYRKPFLLPRDVKDKRKNNAVFLLTPNYESSMNIINHPLFINKYYNSYFLDKDISLYLREDGSLERLSGDNFIHETEVGEETASLNEGIYSHFKKEIIFNGRQDDVKEARRYISISRIDSLNSKLAAPIKYPVSVSVLMREIPNVKTDSRSIYLLSRRIVGLDEVEYQLYCDEEILSLLIHSINPDVNPLICESICMVLSGGFDKYGNDFHDMQLGHMIFPCKSIQSILEKRNGYHELYNIIKKNDIAKICKNGIKNTFNFNEAGGTDIIKSLRRKIKINTRKSSKYITNKISRDISKVVDPNEKTPDFSQADEGEKVNMPNAAEVKAKIQAATAPKTNSPSTSSSEETSAEESYVYETSFHSLFTEPLLETGMETFNEDYNVYNSIITFFNEASPNYTNQLKKILYRERLRNNKAVINIYDKVKNDCNGIIKYTYLSYHKYKNLNLFVDLYYYNELFFKNSMYDGKRGYDLYKDFLNRLINNKNFDKSGYNKKKTIFIPVLDWDVNPKTKMWMYTKNINPISIIYKLMLEKNISELQKIFGDSDLVFITNTNYFKINFSKTTENIASKFIVLIKKLLDTGMSTKGLPEDNDVVNDKSDKAITNNIIDKIEDNMDIKVSNLTGSTTDKKELDKTEKEILVDKINKAAATSEDEGEAMDKLDEDEEFKKILLTLADDEEKVGPEITNSRKNRIKSLDDEFLNKEVKGMKVIDIINKQSNLTSAKLQPKSLPVDSINEEWKELYFPSMAEQYDPNDDIIAILRSFSQMTYPISIRDINLEDNSTSEDYIYTYNVDMENHLGKRFKLKFDVPKIKDSKYMMLRGNKKNIQTQCFLMPLVKTDADAVQIVSNYSKIFIRRFNTSTGKSSVYADFIMKCLKKYDGNDIIVTEGDNSVICQRYNLPIDYVDLASVYSKIEVKGNDLTYYFNIEELQKNTSEKIDFKKGIPAAINNKNKSIVYFDNKFWAESSKDKRSGGFSEWLYWGIQTDASLIEITNKLKPSTKYTYSKASIMSTEIPVIVLAAYSEGLTKVLDKSGITYEFVEKKPKNDYLTYDIIKFSDGYLTYNITPASSMLMNGLKECSTELYSVGDMNKRSTFLDFIEQFGGRLKADGFDNFYDCMIDPITESILDYCKLPKDYVSLLLYANNLLVDNSFVGNGDMSSRRLRRNEIIAAYAYKALSGAYGSYATSLKHGRETTMSMKQSAIIDAILLDNTGGDLSILNALGEKEAYDTATYKGLSGMNNDRSYSLDKRGYDKSMINVLGMSTGFAGTVGINRQITINSQVDTVRGFVKPAKEEEMNSVNSLCMSEALTPMGTTRDDPFRSAMTYVQTTKHGMRVKQSDPLLVTNGADEALPYLVSNIFAHKAKEDGEVIEKGEDYLIISYKSGTNEYINLKENVEKNSSAGFYVTLKLDTDLKEGDKVKAGSIVAYDKSSFSPDVGINNNPAYKIGTLASCALLSTSEGFEDSTIISEPLSKAMSNDVVVEKTITLNKNTNIYNMVNIGDPLEEGDTLLVIQNAYDEEDANNLLKNLVDDPEEVTNLGRIPIKSKVTGFVQDIKIYRTVELDELSDSLRALCKKYEKDIKSKKNIMNKHKIDQLEELDADYKLPATGKLKDAGDGVKIIFYLKYNDRMSIGDKLINWSANKGVVKYIMPAGKEAYVLDRPEEKIHCLVSIDSCNGRMVTSIQNIGVQNRLLIEAANKAKQMAGLPVNYNNLIEFEKDK